MSSDCLVTYVTLSSSYDSAFSKVYPGEMTPQGRLERLKQTLKSKIKLMENQDGTIQELETHLRRAKEDLALLKEKCDRKDKNRQFIELAKYEDKLRRFREILLGATSHLEKVLRNMARCHGCSNCPCHRWAGEESSTINCIRKDLESLQIKINLSDSRDTCGSGIQTADSTKSGTLKKCRTLNVRDFEKFREKSLAGVNALNEMKEQVDILHELVKNYFKQMPSDYEKCQIEECEIKFEKLQEEFDGITEALSELLDSLNSTLSDASDEGNSGRNRSSCDTSALKSAHKELQREISEKQTQLEKVKSELKKAEVALRERKCQAEEQEKDLRSREEEISELRAGVRGFRERLKEMQMEISNDDDGRRMVTSEGSCSSLSILSSELQELCEILTSTQMSFPAVVEKFREENHQMRSTICCLEKCLDNKEQTLALLQKTLKLRDGQIEDLNCRIQSLEGHIEKLNQEICEKTRLIGNLQDSMRKAKEFEMKIKDECIATLQCELCELDSSLKAMAQEVATKTKELDDLQDEILYVSSKNFFLNREIDLMEPKLGKMQKNLVLYETMVCELQKELNSRQCEIEELYEKVRVLEQELECETRKCEQQTLDDTEHINQLNETIRHLQNELECINSSSKKSSPVGSGRSPKRSSECNEIEDPNKIQNPNEVICQLRAEIKALKQRVKQAEKQDAIKAKVAHLEGIIKQGECCQQMYNDEINKLRKIFEVTVATHQREKERLMEKLQKEEMDNCKNKSILCKLNESIKSKMTVENALKETIQKLRCELESFKSENESLKSQLENVKRNVRDNRNELDREDLDKLITELEAQKSDLKTRCCTLKCELEKEEKMKKCLENRINELNNMLSEKTLQFQQLSQNYKFTTAEAQEALAKLKDAEDRLKCMKMAMNKNQDEFREEDCEDEIDDMQRKSLEDSLTAKTVECNNLMNEVERLHEKLKTVQNKYVAAQANKDFELERANGEIHRLENELDLVEKQNAMLRKEIKILQDEVQKLTKLEECSREERKNKEKELCDLSCEKKVLLESIDELQKRLEEICIDNTAKENENMTLREQTMNLRKEMRDMESEMCDTRQDFETLRQECSQTAEQLSCSERKIGNLKKLYKKAMEENANLEQMRCNVEKELYQLRSENIILKQRMQCARKHKEMEARKFMAENATATEEKLRLSSVIKDLNGKVKILEERVIPQLQEEILRKNRYIETFKMELRDANSTGQRMRDESMRVIQSTKKYLAAQRNGNEPPRAKSPYQRDNCYSDNRDLEEQYKSACINTHYFQVHEKNPYQDAEPRSFSPQPWGCSNVARDNSSPDYAVESGFQSMQPSPTNMNYIDYGHDTKRTMSQWNNVVRQVENQYPCRSPSTR